MLFKDIKSKIKHIAMLFFIMLLVICLIFFDGCVSEKKSAKGDIEGLSYRSNVPVVTTDKGLINITDSIALFYYGDYILNKLPYKQLDENLKINETSIKNVFEIEDSIKSTQILYKYVTYKKSGKFCYFFKDLAASMYEKRTLVDSLLQARFFSDFKISEVLKSTDSLKEYIDVKTGDLIKTFLPKTSWENGDTLVLYFNKAYKNFTFTMSKEIDSVSPDFKLYKIRIPCNEKYSETYKMVVPKREFLFEIRELTVNNEREIIIFFDRIKKWL